MFKIGEYVVCPGHGVGQICDIETKEVGGQNQTYYIIKIVSNGMKVMLPTSAREAIRELVSEHEVNDVFGLLKNHDVKMDTSTWNRRHRDYLTKVKTGSLVEIADVLRSLYLLKVSKKLSFGEKKMLDQCKDLIVSEIAISQGMQENAVNGKIDSCFG